MTMKQLLASQVSIYITLQNILDLIRIHASIKDLVKAGDTIQSGDVIADGASTSLGELAIGQNLLVAFMPWNGFNFEDSILISERVVQDRFTTIHIEELQCIAKGHKIRLRRSHSRYSECWGLALRKLDESIIAYIGAEVVAGDILVGKITPKGESQLTPEEKPYLEQSLEKKTSDVKDTSLGVPSGMDGTVIDVRVFSREGVEKDDRSNEIEAADIESVRKDLKDQLRIVESDIFNRLEKLLLNKSAKVGRKTS